MTEQIEKLMKALDCTEEEAKDIIEQDYKIDHGERVYFDLSKEQEKEAKKFGNVPRAKKVPTVYQFEKKKAKPDPTKEGLIQFLAEKLALICQLCSCGFGGFRSIFAFQKLNLMVNEICQGFITFYFCSQKTKHFLFCHFLFHNNTSFKIFFLFPFGTSLLYHIFSHLSIPFLNFLRNFFLMLM